MNDRERSDETKQLYREADGLCACGRALLIDLNDKTLYTLLMDDDRGKHAVCGDCYTRVMFVEITADLEA